MATTSLTNNFRKGLLVANFDMDTDTINMALYNGSSHNQNTGAYTTVNEAPSTGNYTAKGVTMSGVAQATDTTNHVSYLDWSTDPSWATSTITATDCLIFDETATAPVTDASCYVGDFGGSKSSSSGTFTVVLPAAAYNTAVIRLA
jgi:hypothetical protein